MESRLSLFVPKKQRHPFCQVLPYTAIILAGGENVKKNYFDLLTCKSRKPLSVPPGTNFKGFSFGRRPGKTAVDKKRTAG